MGNNKYQVPALIRAKRILDMLGKREADMTEIMRELELPKSTTYNLLLTLEEIGFVRRLPASQKFTLGFNLFELGNLAVSRVSIRDQAMSFLQDLSNSEKLTCHLGALDGNEAVYLLKVNPPDNILINSWEGKRLTLNRSAMGKILMAWLPDKRREELLEAMEFVQVTPHTIMDKDELRNHLADVRNRKWAVDDEEDILGIRCLSAPVFTPDGQVRYALSVSGMIQQITDDRFPQLRQNLVAAAKKISFALGATEQMWNE